MVTTPTIQKVVADNGKSYDVTIWPNWQASFQSQWNLWLRNFKSLSEAKAAIKAWNPKVVNPVVAWGWAFWWWWADGSFDTPQSTTQPTIKKTTDATQQQPVQWKFQDVNGNFWNTQAEANKASNPIKTETTQKKDTTLPEWVALWTATEQKTWNPDYQDISDARQAEIMTNLAAYQQSNPNLFQSETAFKDFFHYNDRVEWQQKRLETFWNWTAQWKKDTIALNRLNTLSWPELAAITLEEAALLQWTAKYDEWTKAVQEKQKLDTINWWTATTDTNPYSIANLMKAFGVDMGAAESISDETKTLRAEVETAKTEYESAKLAYDNVLLDVRKEYTGTGVTDTFIRAMAAKKQEGMVIDVNTKLNAYNTKISWYNTLLEEKKLDAAAKSQKLNDFASIFSIYKSNYEMTNATKQSQVIANPVWWIWEKQSDWTRKDITGISGIWQDTSWWYTTTTTGDLTWLAAQYPNEASFKNNNPTGIKFTAASPALKKLWDDAGIKYSQWTGATDWWAFAKFETIEDGMKAYDIAMTQRRGNATVKTYLDSRGTWSSGTWLSTDILWKKINTLTADEKAQVQSAQIKKESPWLWKQLYGWNVDWNVSVPTTNAWTEYVNVNGKQIATDAFKTQFIKDPLSVFTAAQITAFEQYSTTADYKKLWTSVKAINDNLKAYEIWKRVKTTSPEELWQIYIALSVLPVQLRNNEKELEMAVDMIKKNLASGMSAYEAADIFRGFDAKAIKASGWENAVTLWMNLRYLLNQLPDADQINVWSIWRMLVDKKYSEAILATENSLIKWMWGSESLLVEQNLISFSKSIKKLNPLWAGLGAVWWITRSRLGAISKNRAAWIAQLNLSNSKMKLWLEPLTAWDTTNEIEARFKIIASDAMESLNAQRIDIWLPIFTDISQIVTPSERLKLYNKYLWWNYSPSTWNLLNMMQSAQ